MKKALLYILVAAVLAGGYLVLDNLLYDGIAPTSVNTDGFQGTYFAQDGTHNQPGVMLLGGGQWGDYWAQELAKAGYPGLSLPYSNREGLPPLPEEIPIEYFERAINWFQDQPAVDPNKVIIMGASRNAELALVVASTLNRRVSGAIAYCPSSVSWSNTVLPYNSDEVKPSWTYRGQAIPFVPMPKLKAPDSGKLETLSYWRSADSAAVAQAAIPVEQIKGPILLLSGSDDQVWPSAEMAEHLTRRALASPSYTHTITNKIWDDAGHMISGDPNSPSNVRQGTMVIDGESYAYDFGGTEQGDAIAKQQAADEVWRFLNNLRSTP